MGVLKEILYSHSHNALLNFKDHSILDALIILSKILYLKFQIIYWFVVVGSLYLMSDTISAQNTFKFVYCKIECHYH